MSRGREIGIPDVGIVKKKLGTMAADGRCYIRFLLERGDAGQARGKPFEADYRRAPKEFSPNNHKSRRNHVGWDNG